ncbi:MAG: YceI family protein [Candidatus Jacksonbacteria bacterium]|jgi:polyisoprenoid-binding protein YceI|nr:YceI family protein [Candidatus Jacksonbacteria bacterium]MBT6300887.1 YceI family protein [Candidatus Jacksonbacteria bacterium]MBT6756884.1 YceI family protein [Candidatus Jacksonbacteria bacterium]
MSTHGKIFGFVVLVAIVIIAISLNNRAQQTPTVSDNTPPIQSATGSANLSFVSQLGDGTYVVDEENTTLGWSAERIVGSNHSGTVPVQGSVEITSEEATGVFTIDMTQISEATSNTRFLGHLASADFFDVETYSTAILSLTDILGAEGDNAYTVMADLTIKDISNSITFPVEITEADNQITAVADFEIDRTMWDINFDSGSIFQEIGDKAIKDEIQFNLQLSLVKE